MRMRPLPRSGRAAATVFLSALAIAACSGEPAVLRQARTILALEKRHAASDSPIEEHRRELTEAYRRGLGANLGRIAPPDCPADCLRTVFEAVATVAFYSDDPATVLEQEKVFVKLGEIGSQSADDVRKMHRALLTGRFFDRARSLDERFPRLGLEPVPAVLGDQGPVRHGAFALGPDGRALRAEALDMAGDRIVVLSTPLCAFSRRAFADIEADPVLRKAFGGKTLLLVPPSGSLDLKELSVWNAAHPSFPMRLAGREADWPEVDEWLSTPGFYFVKDGKTVYKQISWPAGGAKKELLAGLRALGSSRTE